MRITKVDGPASWRNNLLIASFRGNQFHVEQGGVAGGRRLVPHEYPKRNTPFTEDMGRRAFRWPIQGYIIVSPPRSWPGLDYIPARDALANALDADGPGILVHPTIRQGNPINVMVEHYTLLETREKGGYASFEMVFLERGQPVNFDVNLATAAAAQGQAQGTAVAVSQFLDRNIGLASQPNLGLDAASIFGNFR